MNAFNECCPRQTLPAFGFESEDLAIGSCLFEGVGPTVYGEFPHKLFLNAPNIS